VPPVARVSSAPRLGPTPRSEAAGASKGSISEGGVASGTDTAISARIMDQKPATAALDPRRRRILFRATHRGTKETDILVGGYVTARIASMAESELDALEAVMDLPDPLLADWLTGRLPLPPEVDSPLLRAMRDAAGT